MVLLWPWCEQVSTFILRVKFVRLSCVLEDWFTCRRVEGVLSAKLVHDGLVLQQLPVVRFVKPSSSNRSQRIQSQTVPDDWSKTPFEKLKLKDLIEKTKKAHHFLTRSCVCLFVRLDSIFEAHFGRHTYCGPPLNLTGLLQIDLARVEGHLGKKLCDIPRPGLNQFNKMFTWTEPHLED